MKTKKYFSDTTQTYKNMLWVSVPLGIIALVSLVSIITAVCDTDIGELLIEDVFGNFYIAGIVAFLSASVSFGLLSGLRAMKKFPVLEIDDDRIRVTNLGSGIVNEIRYSDIDRLEISEVKVFGKRIKCINIFATADASRKIISYSKDYQKKRIENIYKTTGAIEQIYENLLDKSVVAVYDNIMENIEEYRKTLSK
jgi:hypothetical protein